MSNNAHIGTENKKKNFVYKWMKDKIVKITEQVAGLKKTHLQQTVYEASITKIDKTWWQPCNIYGRSCYSKKKICFSEKDSYGLMRGGGFPLK